MKTATENFTLLDQEPSRPAWSKPELMDYGRVANLTQSGTFTSAYEDTFYTSVT